MTSAASSGPAACTSSDSVSSLARTSRWPPWSGGVRMRTARRISPSSCSSSTAGAPGPMASAPASERILPSDSTALWSRSRPRPPWRCRLEPAVIPCAAPASRVALSRPVQPVVELLGGDRLGDVAGGVHRVHSEEDALLASVRARAQGGEPAEIGHHDVAGRGLVEQRVQLRPDGPSVASLPSSWRVREAGKPKVCCWISLISRTSLAPLERRGPDGYSWCQPQGPTCRTAARSPAILHVPYCSRLVEVFPKMISLLMATSVEAYRFRAEEACMAMPTITRQPEPCTVEAGETARFEVTAEGKASASSGSSGPSTSPGRPARPTSWSPSRATTDPSSASSSRTRTGPPRPAFPPR